MQFDHACAVQTHIWACFWNAFSGLQKNQKIEMVPLSGQGHLGHISDKGGTGRTAGRQLGGIWEASGGQAPKVLPKVV